VKLKECLDLTKLHNAELDYLAKPLRAGLKARFFVVATLGHRITKTGEPRLEAATFKSRRIQQGLIEVPKYETQELF
jgi:hypothetical protein